MHRLLPLVLLVTACDSGAGDLPELEVAIDPAIAEVGDFSVEISNDGVEITHPARPDSPVWSSLPGRAFMLGAIAEAEFNYSRGSFFITDDRRATCRRQSIDALATAGAELVIRGRLLECGDAGEVDYELRLAAGGPRRLELTAAVLGESAINRLVVRYRNHGERFFGFGAQYSELDLSGKTLPIWSQEQGHGRGLQPLTGILNSVGGGAAGAWHTSYTAVPFYLTDQSRAIALETSEYVEFDLDRGHEVVITAHTTSLSGHIFAGSNPAEILEAHTEVTGRMQPLPDWAGDGILLRAHGGAIEVRERLDAVEAAGVPVAAVWIEDWVGTRETFTGTRLKWNWRVDTALYPDWPELIAELRGRGVRVLTYFNPFLATGYPLYDEGAERGYLVKRADGAPYVIGQGGFDAAMVDLTNPLAVEWLTAIMVEQLQLGVSGWMNDFGEALPPDAVLDSGDDPLSFHNRYPERWAAVARDAIRRAGLEGDAMFYSRSGSSRSPGEATLFWLGDQLTTWDDHDGIKTVVKGLISSGLSGYTLNHPDVGGYFSIEQVGVSIERDRELLQRWAELAAFTAAFRTHDTNRPHDNHQIDSDPETLAHVASVARVFAALAPYRARLMREAATRGLPLVRHPALLAPDEPEAWSLSAQFGLGPDLMIAPVLEPLADSVDIWLPAGEWVHLITGERIALDAARTIRASAPLGTPAAYYRAGTPELEQLF